MGLGRLRLGQMKKPVIILNTILVVGVLVAVSYRASERRRMREEISRTMTPSGQSSPIATKSVIPSPEPSTAGKLLPKPKELVNPNIPVKKIAREWEKKLEAYLLESDRENGKETFRLYRIERRRYMDRVHYGKLDDYWNRLTDTSREQWAPDRDPTDPEDKQRRILHMTFGSHMPGVERLHREYNQTIQHYSDGGPIYVPLF